MYRSIRNRLLAALAEIGAAACCVTALANVNLEWRPAHQADCVGSTVRIGLYAVSDEPETDQLMAAMDVIVEWDPAYLQLAGVDNSGTCDWLFSGFLPDAYGLNEVIPPQDGDGIYTAFAFLGEPVAATPEGAMVTTFVFTALEQTPSTTLEILESGGSPAAYTVVYDGTVPNHDVTGTLGSATAELAYLPGDLDRDGTVALSDLSILLTHFGLPAVQTYDDGDLDGDGDVDLADLSDLLTVYGSSCP